MTDDYRARLIEAAQNAELQEFRQKLRTISTEDLENAVCESLGVPRGTQFSIEQLELLIESHKMRSQALNH